MVEAVVAGGLATVLFVHGGLGEVLEGIEEAGELTGPGLGQAARGAKAPQVLDEIVQGGRGLVIGGGAGGQLADEGLHGVHVDAQLGEQGVEGPGGIVGGHGVYWWCGHPEWGSSGVVWNHWFNLSS